MFGADFYDFWATGRSILLGEGAYSYVNSVYPPITALIYVLLAVLPFKVSFGLWTGLNFIAFLRLTNKFGRVIKRFAWFFFTPLLFTLAIGQIDLLLFWLSQLIQRGGWLAILAATLITIKPQVAFIVLPWYLVYWVIKDRKQLFRWVSCTLILHGLPLLYDPTIYQQWFSSLQDQNTKRVLASTGIFTLSNLNIPIWLLSISALLIIIYGLRRDHATSISAQILAFPWGIWYENVFLIGIAPWWLMIPISWIAFILAYFLTNSFPFLLIPLTSFLWTLFHKNS